MYDFAFRFAAVILLAYVCGSKVIDSPPVKDEQSKPASNVVSARAFHVVDDSGLTRIAMGMDDCGVPSIKLFESNGKTAVWISLGDRGMSTIALLSDGVPRVSIGIEHMQSPVIRMTGEAGVTRLGLGASPDGSSGIWLASREGEPVLHLAVSKTGSPSITLVGPDGKSLFAAP